MLMPKCSDLTLQACCQCEVFKLCSLVCQSTFRGKVPCEEQESFLSPHPYCLLGVSQASGPGTEMKWGQVSRQQRRDFTGEWSARACGNVPFGNRKEHAADLTYTRTHSYMCVCVCIYVSHNTSYSYSVSLLLTWLLDLYSSVYFNYLTFAILTNKDEHWRNSIGVEVI